MLVAEAPGDATLTLVMIAMISPPPMVFSTRLACDPEKIAREVTLAYCDRGRSPLECAECSHLATT